MVISPSELERRAKIDAEFNSRVQQTISLIERGKAGIAGQDPRLRDIANTLSSLGYRQLGKIRNITPFEQKIIQQRINESAKGLLAGQSMTTQFGVISKPKIPKSSVDTRTLKLLRQGTQVRQLQSSLQNRQALNLKQKQSIITPTQRAFQNMINQNKERFVTTKKGTVDITTGNVVKTVGDIQKVRANFKFPITNKIEKVLFDKGLLDKNKFRAWERSQMKKAIEWNQLKNKNIIKFKSTPFGKDVNLFWDNAGIFAEGLFITLPKALFNVGIIASEAVGRATNDPKKFMLATQSNLNKASSLVSNMVKKQYSKNDSPKKIIQNTIDLYIKHLTLNIRFSKFEKRQLIKISKKLYNIPGSVILLMNKFKDLNLNQIGNFSRGVKQFTKATLVSTVIKTGASLRDTPAGIAELITNPENIVKIPGQIKADVKETIFLVRTNPSEGIAKIASTYFTFKIISRGIKFTGKISNTAKLKYSPFLKRMNKKGVFSFKAPEESFIRKGKETYLKKRVPLKPNLWDRLMGRKPGQFKKFQKKPGIKLTPTTIGKGATFTEQASFAGKVGTKNIITTVQAVKLLKWYKRTNVIRKPLPNNIENKLSSTYKLLLEKFDKGISTNAEFVKLNKHLIRKYGNKTLLERSTYADPSGGIRWTRFAGENLREANLKDILSGNFSLRKPSKGQILIFPEDKIASFPPAIKKLVNKLERTGTLTELERIKLTKWEVKATGEWKGIGDIKWKGGKELEVTLAPGNRIRLVRKLKTIVIDKETVDVLIAKTLKINKTSFNLIKKLKLGKLNIKLPELNKLKNLLSKKTKIKITIKDLEKLSKNLKMKSKFKRKQKIVGRRKPNIQKPFLPVKRIGITSVIKTARKRATAKRKVTKRLPTKRTPTTRTPNKRQPTKRTPTKRTPTKRTPTKRTPNKRQPTKRTPTKRTPTKRTPTTRTVVKNPSVKKKIKPPIKLPLKSKNIKRLSKSQPVFDVMYKRKGKFVRANPKPLTREDARDLLSFKLDRLTSRTAKMIPRGNSRTAGIIPPQASGYFNRNKKKLRPYKVRRKKKKPLNGYIERRKYTFDKKGERKRKVKR